MSILSIQVTVTTNFEELYNPIVGATDGHGQEHVETPQLQQERTQKLKKAFEELKADLVRDIVPICLAHLHAPSSQDKVLVSTRGSDSRASLLDLGSLRERMYQRR